MPNPRHHRLTSRVLLFDRDDNVLLFLTKAPDSSGTSRWITPGGGVDPGEDHATAAARELHEETGLRGIPLGEPAWAHDFDVAWDAADHDTGHAEFYTAVVDAFEPSDELWTDDERVDVLEHRWWSLADLETTGEPFEPAELPTLVRTTIALRTLEARELEVEFERFDLDAAWELGTLLVTLARRRGLAITVDITIGAQQAFHAALPGTTDDNDYWIARKIRTVQRYGESSFLVGRRHAAAGTDFNEATGLPFTEYVAHGGCVPIRTVDGIVGTVTVSGLPQRDDHELALEALSAFRGLQETSESAESHRA